MNDKSRMQAVAQILQGLKLLGVDTSAYEKEQGQGKDEIDLSNPDKIPAEAILQNRDRSSKSSVLQMKSIAANPDYDRLSGSKAFGSGAPVVAYGKVPASQRGQVTKAVA